MLSCPSSQCLLTGEMLQPVQHFSGPSLGSPQYVFVFLYSEPRTGYNAPGVASSSVMSRWEKIAEAYPDIKRLHNNMIQ